MDYYRCLHCGLKVGLQAPGTAHRNHCPACLYSQHLDAKKPGDRASSCHGLMVPIGLAFKTEGGQRQGEICLVHRCFDCGVISKNRLAGDDDPQAVLNVFYQSLRQPLPATRLLDQSSEREIITQLFGRPYADKYFASLA